MRSKNSMRRALVTVMGLAVGFACMTSQPLLATPVDQKILNRIGPRLKKPSSGEKGLIEIGRKLFFEETFDGNGRTCGTCHPATNNFTIDPAYISKLPRRDPLFVAEFNRQLKGLENPRLMRRFGLILENLDGFDKPGVMRAVPHNIGLPTSMKSDLPGKVDALGWSGDGSPGDGALRLFAVGAVMQHLPKSLRRQEGVDFRLPTAAELDAIEAFMRSLGRQQDIDLAALSFTEDVVEEGKDLFQGVGVNRACSACHMNAGANRPDGTNANFDTGTRLLTPKGAPPDGGFGMAPATRGFGDGTMNPPPLIEAADTPPFFHNNAARTLEDAIRFYTTATFGNSPAGQFGGAFQLTKLQINAIGALLRTLNARENVRFGNTIAQQALTTVPKSAADRRIREALAETKDAVEVLERGPRKLYREQVKDLKAAAGLEQRALRERSRSRRNSLLQQAIALKSDAAAAMIE
jgi:cytochrome c peroxidase